MIRFLLATAGVASCAALGDSVLYGVTADGNLVTIDLATAQATIVAPVGAAGPMTYDPVLGRLAVIMGPGEPGSLILIDPETATATTPVSITGLPPDQQKTGGIGYDGTEQGLVVTFGPTGTTLENRIALIDGQGVATMLSPNLGLGDNDGLFWDAFNDRLLVNDFNASDGLPPLAAVSDVFGSPAVVSVANPPSNQNAGDAAADPDTGRIFIREASTGGDRLIELVGDAYVDIGPFNVGVAVVGIAFAPAPAGCPADLAEPFGTLNIFDIQAYIGLYNAQDPAADLAEPFGSFNIFDIQAYIGLYNQGCP